MTPRQISAWHYFVSRRKRFEAADRLSSGTLAARGEESALKEQFKDLTFDG
jgi:hypothetical protein